MGYTFKIFLFKKKPDDFLKGKIEVYQEEGRCWFSTVGHWDVQHAMHED